MIRKIARPMLASVYIADGVDTLVNTEGHVKNTETVLTKLRGVLPADWARQVPNDPELVARAVGATKVGAGSLLALGKAPRLSAGTLAILAVPTIIGRHNFWEAETTEEKSTRRNGFLTSIALLGGLGITSMDTAGRPGLAWRAQRAGHDVNKKVQAALPTQSETEKATAQATDWISDKTHHAQDAVASFVDENKDDWQKTAAAAAATAGTWYGQAKSVGQEAIETVRKEAPTWVEQARETGSHLFHDAEKTGRDWLDAAQADAKGAGKRAVKVADKAQTRAEKAIDKADATTGRSYDRAAKRATRLQHQADKAIDRAVRKVAKY
ncbi:DoxX family protein [Corynebacterium guangdongense]|uniref:Uncharacterized membrane protein YphA (DoxX/SURF4 family)/ElaB/YqjD/DUF883 family membrane-anchored ribosome-binding protein n=1 Tax=Corynebacterium guangdongense TaxID=1783348 RepID=A0ABU1ZWF3_9CORY|nr:DoxX family protein [Corynebacterium guangdongense]MDR7329246.1 uncharacterized membrane protein YphA (DoxX/SURF4 family)/ElaB/YqjD/DUF883 family membrane-anchored ribosome-binding protein [Corynebacterium guangdongense]WJZ17812.1 DoxX [Corynebacterium guangdongense]